MTDCLTHVGMAEENSFAAERLWMYITMIDEPKDVPHKNITKIKYISAHEQINFALVSATKFPVSK